MNISAKNLSRRNMLKVGMLGAGFSLSNFLRLQAAAAKPDEGRSAILVWLWGGPSHQDTFDLKPEAPVEYRGEFNPIATASPGVEICEHMPQLARRSEKYAVIRGISHNLAEHELGASYIMTGNRPTPVVKYPLFGSVVSREFPAAADLPSFVSIDRSYQSVGPGYLGPEYAPLLTGEKPRYGRPFKVRGITLDESLSIAKYQSRRQLLADLDTTFRGYEGLDEATRGLDRFSEQAHQIITSARARDAFDLTRESERESERFGRHQFGQSLLLTCRLVESGVRFVTVILENWDTHSDNFSTLSRDLFPPFDQALSAMLDRLEERGQLQSTAVLVTGEFGRTPKVNEEAGRDHWARAMCALQAGGDIRGGQVLGATDDKAQGPAGDGYTPDDLAASFFRNIGINPKKEYDSNVGRPITLIRDGEPIRGLFA